MYLYFKDNGTLFIKSKIQDSELETEYTKKLTVPNDFTITKKITDNSDTDTNGTEIEVEKTYDEIVNSLSYKELKDAEQTAIDKKASGKQKLKDLGLDDDEIQALIGV